MLFFQDIEALAGKLPNVIEKLKIPYPSFNHLDFMWAINSRKLLYDQLLLLLNKYIENWFVDFLAVLPPSFSFLRFQTEKNFFVNNNDIVTIYFNFHIKYLVSDKEESLFVYSIEMIFFNCR